MTETERPIPCGLCGAHLAHEITTPEGKSYLRLGGVLVDMIRGACSACGHPFSWWTRDGYREMRRLVDRS